jgi:integrase
VGRLLDAVDPHYAPLFLTAVHTGMRLGELLGLVWGDLDWAGSRIHVRRSVYKGQPFVPKSKRGKRFIDIGDQLIGALRTLERARYGDDGAPLDALVFVTPQGSRIDPDNLRGRVWEKALKKAGLRHVKIHSLRHTYASLLVDQGENLLYVSRQLGHASIQMTADVYGHRLKDQRKQTAASKLEETLLGTRAVLSPSNVSQIQHP